MPTAVCRIFGRIMHSQTALRSQLDKGRKNNPLFASPSIRRPTCSPLPLKENGKLINFSSQLFAVHPDHIFHFLSAEPADRRKLVFSKNAVRKHWSMRC